MNEVFGLRLFGDDPRAGQALLKLIDPSATGAGARGRRLFDEGRPDRPARLVKAPPGRSAPREARAAKVIAPPPAAGHAGLPLPVFIGGRENRLLLPIVDEVLGVRLWDWIVPPEDGSAGPPAPGQGDLFAAERGGDSPGVIVFFGPPGVGKSHLLRGLSSALAGYQFATTVVTGADFARDYARAVDEDTVGDFRDRLVRCGIVMIENLQDLEEKPAAQIELRHLADRLADRGGRLILTSAAPPVAMPRLEPGLAGRLSGGLTLPVHPPRAAARRIILERLAARHRLPLSDRALDRLTERAAGTVPRLQGLILELLAKDRQRRQAAVAAEATATPPADGPSPRLPSAAEPASDVDPIETVLADRAAAERPTLARITHQVAKYFRTRTSDLKGPSRKQAVVTARSVAMYLARELTDASLSQVGDHFGGRDHTTVLHATRKTKESIASDHRIQVAVRDLRKSLGQVET